jgi:uncharacterized protein YkwD
MRFDALIRPRATVSALILLTAAAGCARFDARPREISRSAQARDALSDPAEAGDELVELHNRIRAARRLGPLETSTELQAAAELHAREMANRHRMTHRGSGGSSPSSRMNAQGYRFIQCGENIAFGQATSGEVMSSWMKSPPHRANILGSFSQIGAACAIAADGSSFWCVTFGLPARRNPPPGSQDSAMLTRSVDEAWSN